MKEIFAYNQQDILIVYILFLSLRKKKKQKHWSEHGFENQQYKRLRLLKVFARLDTAKRYKL